jgi:hypothetical protein
VNVCSVSASTSKDSKMLVLNLVLAYPINQPGIWVITKIFPKKKKKNLKRSHPQCLRGGFFGGIHRLNVVGRRDIETLNALGN